ncbi:amino acid adenylation domain-containing protein [Sorangium sp. So ce327]
MRNKKNVQAIYPLTPLQQGMLLHALEAPPGGDPYLLQLCFHLRGRLDREAFARAWGQVAARHDALRSDVEWQKTREPVQIVYRETQPVVRAVSWSAAPADDASARLASFLREERARGFDLARSADPRLTLIELGPEEHAFVWEIHHILLDGWSVANVLGEVLAHYRADSRGERSPLSMVPPYASYVKWLKERDHGAAERFFRSALAGYDRPIEFPGRPGPGQEGSARFAEQRVVLEREESERLRAVTRDWKVTLNTYFQGVWALLVKACTGSDDIVFGATVSGRPPEIGGVDRMAGMFINTLPVRVKINPAERALGWLRRIQAYSGELRQFEHSSLARIGADRGRESPLFESIVVFENYPVATVLDGLSDLGLRVSVLKPEESASGDVIFNRGRNSYPLTLVVAPGDRIEVALSYHCDRVSHEAARTMLRRFRDLSAELLRDAEAPLSSLGRAPHAGAADIPAGGAAEAAPRVQGGVHELFARAAAQRPSAVAVKVERDALSYGELEQRANRLSSYLRSRGVGAESRVGLWLPRSTGLLVGLVGVLKSGAAYVPLDPKQPEARLREMVQDSGARVVLGEESARRALSGLDVEVITPAEAESMAPAEGEKSAPVSAEQAAYVIYTSGSTGRPKGVVVTHRGVVSYVQALLSRLSLPEEASLAMVSTIAADLGNTVLFGALCSGRTLHLLSDERVFDPDAMAELMHAEGVDVLKIVPSHLKGLLQSSHPERVLPRHTLILGGEATSWELLEQIRRHGSCRVVNHYGPTETTVGVLTHEHRPEQAAASATLPLGKPLSNSRVYVLGSDLQPMPSGVAGEVYIGGQGVARGYLGRADLTADRFVPDPFGEAGERLYRTGDRAKYLEDGSIEFLGRVDEQVKVRGYRIELGEVRAALLSLAEVSDAQVLVQEGQAGNARLVAYVIGKEGARDGAALEARLRERLPDYMVPGDYVFLDAFPLTPNGKLDRKALPAPAKAEAAQDVPPRTETEKKLAAIWCEVLKRDRIGVHDNFFKLGGDSILTLQVVARARRAGIKLTPKQMFANQTLAEAASAAQPLAVAREPKDEAAAGDVELTPIQRWFFEQEFPAAHHWNQSVLLEVTARLDVALLDRALQAIVQHHDALRMRFRKEGGRWRQRYGEGSPSGLVRHVDLSAEVDVAAAIERVAGEAQRSLDLAEGPLLRAVAMDLGSGQSGRLLLAVHHLVVDGVSWRILLEDLRTAYRQLEAGAQVALPARSSSFQQWSRALRDHAGSDGIQQDLARWRSAVEAPEPELPAANPRGRNTVATARTVHAELGEAETARLLADASRAYRTQIGDLLLTALAQALCAWSERDSVLVELEGHGREDLFDSLDVTRTVGWFTTLYPVRLAPDPRDMARSIKAIKEQLRQVPGRGLSYGVLRYLHPGGEALARGARPLVTFNYLGQFDQVFEGDGLFAVARESAGESRAPDSARRAWLDVNALIHGGRLRVELVYSAEIHGAAEMARLSELYVTRLRAVIEHCCSSGASGATPSDFPLVRASQAALDAIGLDYRSVEDIYPMTPMQQGLMLHSMLSAGSGIYHMQYVYRVNKPVHVEAFCEAWNRVVARHPILRTAFLLGEEAGAIQVVHRDAGPVCELLDLRGLDEVAQRVALDRLLQEELRAGFDLSKPRSFRTRLIRLREGESCFTSSYHHILMDAWCSSLVMRDFLAYYHALVEGREPDLPRLPPYKAYVEWLLRQDADAARAFWKNELKGFAHPTPLAFAALSDRDGAANDRVDDCYESLDEDTTARLHALAKRLGVTLNTVVQAAWALVLSRHAGLDDVVFGVTVAGRPVEIQGAESIVGLFIQSIPLRLCVDAEQRVADWLRAVFDKNAQIRQHEHLPLTDIRLCSEVRGSSLFHSLFVFENAPVDEDVVREGAEMGAEGIKNRTHTNYPITVVLYPYQRFGLHLSYNGDLFQRDEIEALLRHFQAALQGLIDGADRRVGDISILGDAERRMLLGINRDRADLAPPSSYVELFERTVRASPGRVAARCGDAAWSYAELNARANRIGRALVEAGVGLDDVVAVLDERALDLLSMILGVFKAGAAYLPLDPRHPAQRLSDIVRLARPRAVLVSEAFRPALEQALALLPGADRPPVLRLDAIPRGPLYEQDLGIYSGPRNLAYVIYTSGSTGTPKGVMVEQRGMLNNQRSKIPYLGLTDRDVIAQTASQCFDISVWQLLTAPLCGAAVDILPDAIAHDPAALFERVVERGITVLEVVPSLLASALGGDGLPPPERLPLRWLLPTGEALPPDVAQRWLARYPEVPLVNAYGPAECSDDVSLHTLREPPGARDTHVPVGLPVDGTQLYIVDARLALVPVGATGELCVAGVGVGRGYLADPAKTAEVYLPNPFSAEPGDRLYRTGDLARYRPDGVIEVVGRRDHQVKVRGYRIELGEIEARLLDHPGVKDAVVMAREDASGEKRLVAYVVPAQPELARSGSEPLRAALRAALPEYMVPSLYVLLDALPLTANGKVDRKALPEPDGSQPRASYIAPRSELERTLAQSWSEVLRVERVGAHDNFFELGGHSLLAVRMMQALGRALGEPQPLALVFQHQTLAELAEAIGRRARRDPLETLVPMRTGGAKSPLYCVHPAGGHVIRYRPLVERFTGVRPVYGIQARAFTMEDWVDESVASMAEHYADEITRSLRGGVVNLLGHSFGGVVAIEVARACAERGLEIGFLGLIDATALLSPAEQPDGPFAAPPGAGALDDMSRWIEASALRRKWRRLLDAADDGARAWMARQFEAQGLSGKRLDWAEESELFNVVNTHRLMQGYALRPVVFPVHLWWASASVGADGRRLARGGPLSNLTVVSSVVVEGDHDSILLDERLRESVFAAMGD